MEDEFSLNVFKNGKLHIVGLIETNRVRRNLLVIALLIGDLWESVFHSFGYDL